MLQGGVEQNLLHTRRMSLIKLAVLLDGIKMGWTGGDAESSGNNLGCWRVGAAIREYKTLVDTDGNTWGLEFEEVSLHG